MLVGLAPIARPAGAGRSRAAALPDPVEWLFRAAPASWGNLSYSQYVLQFIAYNLWPRKRLEEVWEAVLFSLWLLSISYLASSLVVTPLTARWQRRPPRTLLALALAVSAVGSGVCLADKARGSSSRIGILKDGCGNTVSRPALPPAYVRIAPEAVDVRLNWTVEDLGLGVERTLINPSLQFANGSLLRAARAHAVSCDATYDVPYADVANATVFLTTWHSDVVYDDASDAAAAATATAWASWDVAAWALDGDDRSPLRRVHMRLGAQASGQWAPMCEAAPRWRAENRTLWRTRVSGPEDPKIVLFPGSVPHLIFGSMPVTEACDRTPRYQIFQTLDAVERAADGGYAARAAQLGCGDDYVHEKNWIYFRDGAAHRYVYAISPHVVITTNARGLCEYGHRYLGSPSTGASVALAELAAVRGMRLHGSASAVLWDEATRLALFHTKSERGAYVTYAYLFEASPPYSVLNVSRPLPLAGGNASFASSLAWAPHEADKLVIGYGRETARLHRTPPACVACAWPEGALGVRRPAVHALPNQRCVRWARCCRAVLDAEARVLVISRRHLASLFDWVPYCDALLTPAPPPPAPASPATIADGSGWARPWGLSASCSTSKLLEAARSCLSASCSTSPLRGGSSCTRVDRSVHAALRMRPCPCRPPPI